MLRKRRATRLATFLSTLGAATAAMGMASASAQAAEFVCTTGTIYGLSQTTGALAAVDTAARTTSPIGTVSGVATANGLAIPAGGGRYAYGVQNGSSAAGTVFRFDAETGTTQTFPGPGGVSNAGFPMGGINPVTGLFYYASLTNGTLTLYAFDTRTNTTIGRVASVAVSGSNGDLAFDSLGNLYFVADTALYRVAGPIPTTAGNEPLTATRLATLPSAGNGIAFDGDGTLYLGNSGSYRQIDPATGTTIKTFSTSFAPTDLASCATPNTIRLQKDVAGRAEPGDQFRLAITGGGVTAGNTATTSGADTGVQATAAETAGPVLGRTGTTYTVTETAAGTTNLGRYASTWRCVNTSAGDAVLSSGTGTTGQFRMPAGTSGSDVLCTFRNSPARTALSLDKQAGALTDVDGNGADAGDRITYRFVVQNTGDVALDPVTVRDPKVGAVHCPTGALAPGDTITCGPVGYTVTQADVEAGSVNNTAIATGTPPGGGTPVDSPPDVTSTPTPAVPALTLDKRAGALSDTDGNGVDVGDVIDYTFVVANTGNVPLDPVAVSDPKVGAVRCAPGALAPGGSVTCTAAPYALNQADVDRGHVHNTATATGTPPTGPGVTDTDATTTPLLAAPGIDLAKHAGKLTDVDRNGVAGRGDTIDYTFVVRNTGNVTLDSVAVSDPKVGPVGCPAGSLAPGASVTCGPVSYPVTQDDVDGGSVENRATATGRPPTGPPVSHEAGTTTPLPPAPAIDLDKSAGTVTDVDGNGVTSAGDTVAYRFTVRNVGNVTLAPVTVADPKVGPVTCPAGPLAPGADLTCGTVTYTVTQADIDAGGIDNRATTTGRPPTGPPVEDEDRITTPLASSPALNLTKTAGALADANGNGLEDAGDQLTYAFRVTNTGNVTLTGVTVTDPKIGAVDCPAGPLAPGASVPCTSDPYTVTADDTTPPAGGGASGVTNVAAATADPPMGPPTTDEDTVFTPVPSAPAIQLDKRAGTVVDVDGNGSVDAGDTLEYTFVVSNVGNQPMDPVTITDPLVGPVTCPPGALGLMSSVTCGPVVYTITQADILAGAVSNTATAHGTPPGGGGPIDSPPDTTTTPTPQAPGIALDKQAGELTDVDGNGVVSAGDTLDYAFVVRNTGNVPLDPVRVRDPKVGTIDCPAGALAPDEAVTCDAASPYTVVQADIDRGAVDNTATAIGTPPSGPDVTDDDGQTTPTPPAAAMRLDKQAGAVTDVDDNGMDAGDTLDYRFVVTNTGNVTMDPVTVSDPKVGRVVCPAGPLAPRARMTCGPVGYTLTQADVSADAVSNRASASGTPRSGPPVTEIDTVVTPTPAAQADLSLEKSVNTDAVDVGGLVTYTLLVANRGPSGATGVTLQDDAPEGLVPTAVTPAQGSCAIEGRAVRCALGALSARGTTQVLVTARADGPAGGGELVNTASVDGDQPDPDETNNRSQARVTVRPRPATPPASGSPDLRITKTTRVTRVALGQSVPYVLRVTNHGTAVARDVTVTDTPAAGVRMGAVRPERGTCKAGTPVVCRVGDLAPGAAVEVHLELRPSATGTLRNTASAGSATTGGDPTDDVAGVSVRVARPRISLTKRASRTRITAGRTVTYRLRVRSTGSAAARNVRICDRLPAGTTLTSRGRGRLNGRRLCWSIGTLPAGRSRTVKVTLRVDRTIRTRRVVNTATATATGATTARGSAGVTARGAGAGRAGGVTG
jgi:uncharacterized repeat protein (TIGR01451 family)